MRILLNGQTTEISEDSHLLDLLHSYDLGDKRLVCLLNGTITKDNPQLKPEDNVEIITMVGGG